MLLVSTFEQTLELEEALAVLEKMGVEHSEILVIPMKLYPLDPRQIIFKSEERNSRAFEVGMALATAFGVIGASVGFVFKLGPIIWGLLYAILGFGIGFGGVVFVKRNKQKTARSPGNPKPEVVAIIQCRQTQSEEIQKVLWQYKAISVGETRTGEK
ncbi:hypothetical protein [Paenibacillus cremeus]|uniref:Uncharacterized protein n=1 Tax=Paenibacillus cremeus TaxID=2163881 RepID=A0A559KFT9_9BACL|nr:hypothetical protein [Paenibacillus cremeus]TVY10995.1 hypothetical protein FPZ49_05860 [Paenibacillus cremeus]